MSDVEHQEPQEEQEEPQMEQQPKKEKKLLSPTTNILQISTRRGHRFYMFLAKIFMKSFEEVELHALGQATGMCTRLAESLQRLGFGAITKIETHTHQPKQTLNGPRRYKKIKMIIKILRSENFDDLCGDDLKVAGDDAEWGDWLSTQDSLYQNWCTIYIFLILANLKWCLVKLKFIIFCILSPVKANPLFL